MGTGEFFHKSVLLQEVLVAIRPQKGNWYVDATIGGGGHAEGIIEKGGRVLGIDVDPEAIKHVASRFNVPLKEKYGRLEGRGDNVILVCSSFANLAFVASEFSVSNVFGVLFDLGVSSYQLEDGRRGFSFLKTGPLDMRMSPALAVTAADLVNGLTERELYELFTRFGEEPFARSIARSIVKSRVKKKIEVTKELADLVEKAIGRKGKIHPATRVFQALRIAVNDELNNLEKGLAQAVTILKKGGKLVVISFHSLEDRIVKNFFKGETTLAILNKKPIVPGEVEIKENPRARGAKMRIAVKI